jgi:hypothetical protein
MKTMSEHEIRSNLHQLIQLAIEIGEENVSTGKGGKRQTAPAAAAKKTKKPSPRRVS